MNSADAVSPFPCEAWLGLMTALEQAEDIAALADLAESGRLLCRKLLAGKMGGRLVGRSLSALSDAVTRRVIVLTLRQHVLPATPWCWLAFGSEAREEQTLVTDQDNGIVFAAEDEAEAAALQAYFLPFAQAVNQQLDACGYPLCKGHIMAGNPDCCRSVTAWQESFYTWLRCPEPEALLKGTIFFDMREIYGDASLRASLQDFIAAHGAQSPAFIHLLTENALSAAPPLGLLGELHSEHGVIDLKKFGTRLFVDAARILALAHGVQAVETVQRLEQAGPQAGIRTGEIRAAVEGFLYLQRLRLQSQDRILVWGGPSENQLETGTLPEMELAILKAVFRQARSLQHKLRQTYGFTH